MMNICPSEMNGQPLEMMIEMQSEGIPYSTKGTPILRALREGKALARSESVFWRQDGSSFLAEFQLKPIMDQGKHVVPCWSSVI